MDAHDKLTQYIKDHPGAIGKVIDFNAQTDSLYHFDFTGANTALETRLFFDADEFSCWVNDTLLTNNCTYGIGGYMEHRTIYARSALFDTNSEPRRLHLGVDIWAKPGTWVYSPLQGTVHSFKDNNNFGDYGPTIILEHDLDGLKLYSLYGHLSRQSLRELKVGQQVHIDQKIATLGTANENGRWPPHLHFQLMFDMEGLSGDYPGVGRFSEKEKYLKNIPDPQLILQFPQAVND
jgi:murein DD-endopeptidase MepM/ murein hydrolase activator NlpD